MYKYNLGALTRTPTPEPIYIILRFLKLVVVLMHVASTFCRSLSKFVTPRGPDIPPP